MMENLQFIEKTADYCIVNKPPGVSVQGEVNSLFQQLNSAQQTEHFYPVHRLDKGTSGVLVLARNQQANQLLSAQFRDRKIAKFYLAISDKKPNKKQGRVIGDMEKSRRGAHKLTRTTGNPARTAFVSFAIGGGKRLFLLRLYTGKTHQARVALKAIGAPILGDELYGGTPADRLYLHAWQLTFEWCSETQTYVAPMLYGDAFLQSECFNLITEIHQQERRSWPSILNDAY